jgi:hypothetical protein
MDKQRTVHISKIADFDPSSATVRHKGGVSESQGGVLVSGLDDNRPHDGTPSTPSPMPSGMPAPVMPARK